MNETLTEKYRVLIKASVSQDYTDNYDYYRYGPLQGSTPAIRLNRQLSWQGLKGATRSATKWALVKIGLYHQPTRQESAENWLRPYRDEFEWLHHRLQDQQSRDLLTLILAYRALGHRQIKLPLNTIDYWRTRERLQALTQNTETMETGWQGHKVHRMQLHDFGYPLEIFMSPGGIHTQLLLQQYRCVRDGTAIDVALGDIVIDAGACYGDTAFYFAHKTGEQGRVYSFEFLPENLAIFQRNLELNPDYAPRIKLMVHPLWSTADQELYIEGNGPGTRVVPHSNRPDAQRINTLSIDALVEREGLTGVDFIKMDIEGAELPALQGAEQSIRRFRPKLAISVYHQLQDFWEISQWIDSLDLGYRFYLRHYTIHQEETVLFAQAPR